MTIRKTSRISLLLGCICLLPLQNIWAATVGFADPGSLIPKALFTNSVGASFDIDIIGTDFIELAGGIIDLGFDPDVIQVNSVSVNDSLFSFLPDNGSQGVPGTWLGIGFDVDVIADDPLAVGGFSIASVNLTLLTGAEAVLSLLETSEFFNASAQITPVITDATISSVPVPPAILLMLSGIGLLVRVGRHKGE